MFCEKERKIPRSRHMRPYKRGLCVLVRALRASNGVSLPKGTRQKAKIQKTALRVCLTAEPFRIGRYARAAPLNVSVTLVPSPGSLSSLREAPCSSAPCLTMDSPSPVPPVSREWLLSTR